MTDLPDKISSDSLIENKQDRMLLLIFLTLIIQGVYSQFIQASLIREVMFRFNGIEFSLGVSLASSLIWTAVGCALCRFIKDSANVNPLAGAGMLCMLSGLSAISSVLAAMLLPLSGGSNEIIAQDLGTGLIFAFLLFLPFGLINGALYGLISIIAGKKSGGSSYAADAAGDMGGGLIFSLFLASAAGPLLIAGSGSLLLLTMGIILILKSSSGKTVKAVLLIFGLAAISISLFFATADQRASSFKWKRMLPSFKYEKTLETPSGRIDILNSKLRPGESKKDSQTVIYKDGSLSASIPTDVETGLPSAVFASLQPGHTAISVLLIDSPFSGTANILSQLPHVDSIDFACPDRELIRISKSRGIVPGSSENFRIIDLDGRSYLEENDGAKRYDLILLCGVEPDTLAGNRFFTMDFYRLVRNSLKENGVFVFSISSSGGYAGKISSEFNAVTLATVESVFKKTAMTPGELRFIAAGDKRSEVTDDFAELDKRIEKYIAPTGLVPPGILSVVYSQSEQKKESDRIRRDARDASINTDSEPILPFYYLRFYSRIVSGSFDNPGLAVKVLEYCYLYWKTIAGSLLAIYILLRFLASLKLKSRLLFTSFENGFYAMGLEMLLLLTYQLHSGEIYRDIAAALGVFIGGTAAGAWLTEKYPQTASYAKLSSVAIPLVGILALSEPDFYSGALIFTMLFVSGAAVGSAYSELNERATEGIQDRLWSWEIAGGSIAAIMIPLFLLPSCGFLPCFILMAFLKLPILLKW